MAVWKIKGEAGKGMDATGRTFAALGVHAARLEFGALEGDRFTFEMRTRDFAGTGIDGVNRIPTFGQQIELYKDDARKFRGHVIESKPRMSGVAVTVAGPDYFLFNTPVSSARTGAKDTATDATGERPSYVFPTQSLRASLRDLNNAAVAAGVPITGIPLEGVGDRISAMFEVPKTTISAKSWGDALADLLLWCVDAVPWYDHSGDDKPALNITRRDDMSALTLTMGDDVTDADIEPRLDLEVKRVELHYVTRHPTKGTPRWARQSSGTAVAGKLQMVAISGPDVAALVPKDDFDSVKIQTRAAEFGLLHLFRYDSVLADAAAKYGQFLGGSSGIYMEVPGWYHIISGGTADWMRKDLGLKTKSITVRGVVTGLYDPATGLGKCAGYLKSIGRLGWDVSWLPAGAGTTYLNYWLYVDFTLPAINLSYPKKTTVYKKWDFDYLHPPADLASNLKGTQDWVPWDGTITTIGDEVSGNNTLNRKIRLANSFGVCATMDALLKKVSYDLIHKTTTYTLGAPARMDYGSLINRIRRNPADNIVYL